MKFDVAKAVTDSIIKMIESGVSGNEWKAPWANAFAVPTNYITGKKYRGINVLLLWGAGDSENYKSKYWATYNQWKSKGYTLKDAKNKGKMIVFWKLIDGEKTDKNGNTEKVKIPFLRYSKVFNADLVEGFEEPTENLETITNGERLPSVDKVIEDTGAIIEHGGNRACYIPSVDKINLPTFESFTSVEGYYSTALHELAHWTGHEDRLSRDFSGRFGDESYAFEELIAELSAAFTCSSLGITSETRQDHASYIASWLKVLKNDKKAIITAASQAAKASEYIIAGNAETVKKAA